MRRFPRLIDEIAGIPVRDLAREFGTPTFVYDAATIVARIADLRRFDVVRYAQKACSNLAMLDLVRRHGALVDAVSAGEIHRALAAGYPAQGDPPPIVYTADIFDRESLDLVVEHEHPRQLRLARHDRPVRRARAGPARSRCGSTPASATATARRPTPAASTASTASGTSSSTPASRAPRASACASPASHMHIGSGTDLEHLSQVAEA